MSQEPIYAMNITDIEKGIEQKPFKFGPRIRDAFKSRPSDRIDELEEIIDESIFLDQYLKYCENSLKK